MKIWSAFQAISYFLDYQAAMEGFLGEIAKDPGACLLATELLLYESNTLARPVCAMYYPGAAEATPNRWCGPKSGGLLPLSEVFQEASDWPLERGRFHERSFWFLGK